MSARHPRARRRFLGVVVVATAAIALAWPAGAGAADPPPQPDPQPRIVGGTTAASGEAPWMVALLDASEGYQFCGGTLVAPSWVLTAGHCVSPPAPPVVDVLVGRQDLGAYGGQRIRVEQVIRHPDYTQPDISVNDVALLRLADPSGEHIMPLVPAGYDSTWAPGTNATAYGWGNTTAGGSTYPDELQKATLPIVADDTCGSLYGFYFRAPSMVCAGPVSTGGRDTCDGDSGGPLVVPFGWGVAQVGITSWGQNPCATARHPAVFARLPVYAAWINQNDRFGPLGPSGFVTQAYRDYLGRGPTSDERNFWLYVLSGNVTPGTLIANLNQSDTWQYTAGSVARLYRASFQRDADVGGLAFWINELRRGRSLSDTAANFTGSAEFTDTYGKLGNAQFVDRVYQNVFGRTADAGGRQYWIGRLQSGLTRGGMMIGFSDSKEFRNANSAAIDRLILFFGSIQCLPTSAESQFLAALPLEAIGNGVPANLDYNRRF